VTQHLRLTANLKTALGEAFEWFIGRDGQQFGPVNSSEMGKLIELGHLRPSDLVWRAGFPEWQPAERVFPLAEAASPPPPPPPSPVMAPPPQAAPVAPAPTVRPAAQAAAEAVAGPAQMRGGEPAMRPGGPGPAGAPGPAPGVAPSPTMAPAPAPTGPGPAAPPRDERGPRPEPDRRQRPAPAASTDGGDARPRRQARKQHPPQDHSRRRKRSRAAVGIMLTGLVVVGSAAAAAYVWRDRVAGVITRLTAPAEPVATTPVDAKAALPAMPPAQPESLAAQDAVDTSPVWVFVRGEFPEWHAERKREAQRIRAEKQSEAAVNRYLAEQLVLLRRNYADDALGAPLENLQKVADAFTRSLLELNRYSVDACHGYISHGEASNAVLPLLAQKELSDVIEQQLLAVFEAVAAGRRERVQHLPPRKTDYDQLVVALVRRGWTQGDLQMFSDPRALSAAQPVVVCKLVREWFQAQRVVEDNGAQLRLLAESLRPVVGG
jgi:hypothetical protein